MLRKVNGKRSSLSPHRIVPSHYILATQRCACCGEGTLGKLLEDILAECDVAADRVAAELRVVQCHLGSCAVA